jgi:LmbE family N-acetylglucosaminyl deacetylase
MQRSILVIAPHPDDEVLGCGATIKKYAAAGAKVSLCVVTKAYTPEWSDSFVQGRKKEVARACKILGIKKTYFLDLPTVKLDTIPQKTLNDEIAKIVKECTPDMMFIPHRGDLNTDHRLVHEAALVAARPSAGKGVREVLAYETLSETEWGIEPFAPAVYEDVSRAFAHKLKAMRVYKSELKKFPHPRSLEAIEALGKKRGSEAGVMRAEGFMPVRLVR